MNSNIFQFILSPPTFKKILSLLSFLFVFMLTLLPHNTNAESYASPIDIKYFKGIDTIVVQLQSGPDYKLLDEKFKNQEFELRKAVLEAVKEVFSSESWLKVIQYSDVVERMELLKPSMLGINIALSAQQETIDGKPVKVAAVSVSFKHFLPNGTPEEISTLVPATFPFIVDSDQQAFAEKLQKGVKFLTHYIPANICYANKPRHDCSVTASSYNPWGQ